MRARWLRTRSRDPGEWASSARVVVSAASLVTCNVSRPVRPCQSGTPPTAHYGGLSSTTCVATRSTNARIVFHEYKGWGIAQHHILDRFARIDIEIVKRLVPQEQLRRGHERTGQLHLLLLAGATSIR